MSFPIDNPRWNVMIDNKFTFFGVLDKYYESICKRWNIGEVTSRGYAGEYENHILPQLNDRPLETYTAEELEQVIQNIADSGRNYAPSSLRKYRMHIERVVMMAVENEGMPNPFWGTMFRGVTTIKQARNNECTTLPKSMTLIKQCELGQHIYANAEKSGAVMGDMLTYESGSRPKESAGASFGDFMDFDSFATVALHTSTIGHGHDRYGKLKTPNGYRMLMLSNKAKEIIQRRMGMVRDLIERGEEIEENDGVSAIMRAPIAGREENPLQPYSSVQLSKTFRDILRDIGYDENDFVAAKRIVESDEYVHAVEKVNPKELGFAAERNPTLYIERRQFCTDMHIVNCTAEERQYSMGHCIENTAVDRRDFRNDDVLRRLATKLLKRPSVNKEALTRQCHNVAGGQYNNPDFHDEHVRLEMKGAKIMIWISGHEASAPVTVKLTVPEGVQIKCTYYERKQHSVQRSEANVLNDYYSEYRLAYEMVETKQRLSVRTAAESEEECKIHDE